MIKTLGLRVNYPLKAEAKCSPATYIIEAYAKVDQQPFSLRRHMKITDRAQLESNCSESLEMTMSQ